MSLIQALTIGIHAMLAWILIETFVNMAHGLKRRLYVLWHYIVIVLAFAGMYWLYFKVFHDTSISVFVVSVTVAFFLLLFELVVFRYLYSGERWFLNWVDWMFPMFIAISTVYAMGVWFL